MLIREDIDHCYKQVDILISKNKLGAANMITCIIKIQYLTERNIKIL